MNQPDSDWFQQFLKSGCILTTQAGVAWIGYGATQWSAHPHTGRLSLYAPDFLLETKQPWLIFESGIEISLQELGQRLDEVGGGEHSLPWNDPDREAFAASFAGVQEQIATGQLKKAVPVVSQSAGRSLTPAERARTLFLAIQVSLNFPMMAYGFWTEDGIGMIGATPELLFEQTADSFRTMALAGTRPVQSDRGSLLNDPKEVLEHGLVIEGIEARLTPLGHVTAGMTAELRLPTLIHLFTPISLEPTAPISFEEAVVALHPTPAIGAWPIEAGWEWMKAQSNSHSRGRFGAPFGLLSPSGDVSRCVVAIRNVQWTPAETVLHAGCGVVGPSQLDREWAELRAKLDAIQIALGL